MTSLNVALFGQERRPVEVMAGRAGPVRFEFTDLMLRHIRLGEVELARRIYFAVRAADWDTVEPVEVRDLQVQASASTFRATWTAVCRRSGGPHDVDYQWSGAITGASDGTLRFRADGEVLAGFQSPRIGLNVLLGADVCAGKPFEATGRRMPQGPVRYHEFTRLVGRTTVLESIESLRFCPVPGVDILWSFRGSNTDMEDQRNWSESTYKIFAALRHSYPKLPTAERCEQEVELSLLRRTPLSRKRPGARVVMRVGRASGTVMPSVGVDVHPDDDPLSQGEQRLLAALRPGHLRVRAGAFQRWALDWPVIAVVRGPEEIDALRRMREAGMPIAYIECADLDAPRLAALRAANLDAPIGGPAAADFGHRARLRAAMDAGADFLSWGVNPNAHQEDDQTFLENTRGVCWQIETMRYWRPGKPILIGPVHFEPTYPRPRPDARQAGLLAAAYAAGVLKQAADAGAAAITLFRAAGPMGVIHRHGQHHQPAYHDLESAVYPAWHVLRFMARWRGRSVRSTATSDVLRAECLAVENSVMLINKTTERQEVELTGLRSASIAGLQILDADTFDAVRRGDDPPASALPIRGGRLRLWLNPCAVAFASLK